MQNLSSGAENQPGPRPAPCRPSQTLKRRISVPGNDAQRRCAGEDPQEEKTEALWMSARHLPSLKKGEHLALGGWGGFCGGFLFFELSFFLSGSSSPSQMPPTSAGACSSWPWGHPASHVPATLHRPVRSPPLRSTPPNPTCQQILPQPDTSLDPLPVTSSSTLHLSS